MESAKGNEIKKSEAFYSRELCRIILSSSKEQDIETFVKNTPSLHNNEVILKAAINTSWRGRRPLDLAVEKGDKKSVKFLIDKKAETSYKNFNGVTPLLLACQMEPTNMEVIECLLEKSTSAEIVDELGNTVLHFVCQKEKSNLPLIQLLLMKQDAPVSKENHKKETPLLCVLRYTKKIDDDVIEILDTLLSHPSAPSELILRQAASDGQTPLHVACLRGKPARAAVQFLLDKKADPNFEDNNKIRPIHCACLSEKPDIIIIKLLIESKAIVAVKTQNEDSILHLAASNSNCDSAFIMKVIDILFKHGSELMDSKNSFGMTALRAACLLGNAEVVTALINKITQRQERRKELEFACKAGCIDYIKTNLQKNNRENLLTDTESGPGLLQIAIENNQKSIATEILKCEVWKLALKEQWSPQLNIRSFPTILSALSEKYPDLGLQVCDQCITYNQDQKLASFEYEFFYDNSKHSTPFTRSNSPSLLFPFNRSQGEFFNHPLVEAFSSHKWSYVRNFYLMILFFDAIFVIGFTAYMFATPAPFYPINQTLWKMNKSCVYVKKSGNIHTTSDLSQIMQIILFVCSLVELAKIIFSVTRRTNKWEKLKQLDTIAESLISTMVALGTCPFLPKEYCDYWTAPLPVWQWIMCTIAFCPAWGQFALFYRKMAYANYQLIVHLKVRHFSDLFK